VTVSNPLRISILDKQSNNTYENMYEPQTSQKKNNENYNHKFNNVIIKDFKIYGGPYQVIINSINSSHSLHLPASSSYRNYIGISIPKGFDMTIILFGGNASYVEGELITIDDNKKYKIKVSANTNGYDNIGNYTTEIKFFDVQTDVKNIGSISALMKSPDIKITNKDNQALLEKQLGQGSTAISFIRDSSKNNPIEIHKVNGNITSTIGYVDNYNEHYLDTIRIQFVTYLDQNIQIIKEDDTVTTPGDYNRKKVQIQIPGDISEYAKDHGIEVTWQEAIGSTYSIIMVLSIGTVTISLIVLSWLKIDKLNRKS
jgi:hypothetical protein